MKRIQCPRCGRMVDELYMDEECVRDPDHPQSCPVTCLSCYVPPIAGESDREYRTRIEAARVTAEWRQKSARRLDAGKQEITDSPLWGGQRQSGLFE